MFLPLYWSVWTIHTPYWATSFVATVPRSKSVGGPILNLRGGSVRTLGIMNRAVARAKTAVVAPISHHARAKGLRSTIHSKLRRETSPAGAFFAAAGAGLG